MDARGGVWKTGIFPYGGTGWVFQYSKATNGGECVQGICR